MNPIVIAGAAFAAAVTSLLVVLNVEGPNVPREAKWETPPDVWVMPDSAVKPGEIAAAELWWEDQGFYFSNDVYFPEQNVAPETGVAVIGIPNGGILPDGTLGVTTLWYTGGDDGTPGVMLRTLTVLDTRLADDVRLVVLIHELGHVIGFDHASNKPLGLFTIHPNGHVMSPRVKHMGANTRNMVPDDPPAALTPDAPADAVIHGSL